MGNLGPNAINPAVYKKLPYDPIKDFAPITLTSVVPQIVVVAPSLPIKSVQELIAYAKANRGKVSFASGGNGAPNHLAGELFNAMAGIKMAHIPYRGDTPSLTDVMSGAIAALVTAIAVTSAKRIPSLPDVPTVSESGLPGFESVSWGGVMAPAGTPPEIINRLNTEINRILKLPDVIEKLSALGAEVVGTTPDEFAAYLKVEIAKWGKVARDNDVRLD